MKITQNKKFKYYLSAIAFAMFMFASTFAPTLVFAGDPNISNPTLALCFKEGDATVSKSFDLSNDATGKACTDAGGKIVKGGEPTPVEVCIPPNSKMFIPILNQENRDECIKAKGTTHEEAGIFIPVGSALPKFNSSAASESSDPSCDKDGKDSSGCKIDAGLDCNESNGQINENNCGIIYYLKVMINILSGLMGIVVVGVLTMAGIQYSTSAGDPNAAAAAKKRISNAILAIVAYGMMYGFLQWVIPGGIF